MGLNPVQVVALIAFVLVLAACIVLMASKTKRGK